MDADDRLDESNANRLALLFEELAGPVAYQMTVVSHEARQYDRSRSCVCSRLSPVSGGNTAFTSKSLKAGCGSDTFSVTQAW